MELALSEQAPTFLLLQWLPAMAINGEGREGGVGRGSREEGECENREEEGRGKKKDEGIDPSHHSRESNPEFNSWQA